VSKGAIGFALQHRPGAWLAPVRGVIDQLGFFGADDEYPDGFRYQPELITRDEEAALVAEMQTLPLREFQFHGYVGKRRVASFGWRYDFSERALHQADDLPAFLLPARAKAARFAGVAPEEIVHALVTEYEVGAAIGWHRDKDVFDKVIGISLASACPFRFRRARADGGWDRVTVTVEPRSSYLLSGEAREVWEHSIAAVERLRYSITFRTLRG
jgi:alkylated DNA repair dioxygenase AlkB